ncbi:hypothetical protein BVC80_1741g12 [Macleaya cordata]|uniref:Armadillo n=1 Tax=Macleaya cordata TaxID=56857 RepID=A0A200QKJ4_MACCD|nr:hypothetical protein BVC80_1741g12 [Macleaya cordata]
MADQIKITGLKNDLQQLVKKIAVDDDSNWMTFLDAQRILCELTLLKFNNAIVLPAGINPPTNPVHDNPIAYNVEGISTEETARFSSLLKAIFTGDSEVQKKAAKDLLLLTEETPPIWVLFKSDTAIWKLLSPLEHKDSAHLHPDLQEALITIVLNISIHDEIKEMLLIPRMTTVLIVKAMKEGTLMTRRNAIASVLMLAEYDPNKSTLGRFGGVRALIEIIGSQDLLCLKDLAIQALSRLCSLGENRELTVFDGGIPVILERIKSGRHVSELLPILSMVSGTIVGSISLRERDDDVVPLMLRIIKESDLDGDKEACVFVLYNTYTNPFPVFHKAHYKLKEDARNSHGAVANLAENGTENAREKAKLLLEQLELV